MRDRLYESYYYNKMMRNTRSAVKNQTYRKVETFIKLKNGVNFYDVNPNTIEYKIIYPFINGNQMFNKYSDRLVKLINYDYGNNINNTMGVVDNQEDFYLSCMVSLLNEFWKKGFFIDNHKKDHHQEAKPPIENISLLCHDDDCPKENVFYDLEILERHGMFPKIENMILDDFLDVNEFSQLLNNNNHMVTHFNLMKYFFKRYQITGFTKYDCTNQIIKRRRRRRNNDDDITEVINLEEEEEEKKKKKSYDDDDDDHYFSAREEEEEKSYPFSLKRKVPQDNHNNIIEDNRDRARVKQRRVERDSFQPPHIQSLPEKGEEEEEEEEEAAGASSYYFFDR